MDCIPSPYMRGLHISNIFTFFLTQIKLLITSMQFLWSVNCTSNKIYTLPQPLFPISLYDLVLTFFQVLLNCIIWTQTVIQLIFQMISAITYRITQTISSYVTHVYSMDMYYKLYAWMKYISPFFKIIEKMHVQLLHYFSKLFTIMSLLYLHLFIVCIPIFLSV